MSRFLALEKKKGTKNIFRISYGLGSGDVIINRDHIIEIREHANDGELPRCTTYKITMVTGKKYLVRAKVWDIAGTISGMSEIPEIERY